MPKYKVLPSRAELPFNERLRAKTPTQCTRFKEVATLWQLYDVLSCLHNVHVGHKTKLAERIKTSKVVWLVGRLVEQYLETFQQPLGSHHATEQGFSDNSAGMRALHEGFGCAATAPPEYELHGETSAKVFILLSASGAREICSDFRRGSSVPAV